MARLGLEKPLTMGACCSSNRVNFEEARIISRAVQDIFRHIYTDNDKVFIVTASFLEIYKEDIFDLISKNPDRESLNIREDHTEAKEVKFLYELIFGEK
ncbi:hypothetical protein MRX96_003306 [Rhipicephalus microplus]